MRQLNEMFQTADWKKEKHVPFIQAPERFKKGEMTQVTVTVGKETAHPNTTDHHIEWIDLYFQPRNEKFPYQIAHFDFFAHGASAEGPDTSSVYTHHEGVCRFKTGKPGTLYASSYCNIHGLWQYSMEIEVEEGPGEREAEEAAVTAEKSY